MYSLQFHYDKNQQVKLKHNNDWNQNSLKHQNTYLIGAEIYAQKSCWI